MEKRGEANGRTGKCAGETWRSHWPSHLSMASCFTLPSSVGRMPRGSVNSWPKQGWTTTLTSTSYSLTMEPRHIAVLTSWVLTRSSTFCHLTTHFSISSSRRSARWKRPSRQIFLVQRCKSAWITEMKQEIEGRFGSLPHPVAPRSIVTKRHHNNCW